MLLHLLHQVQLGPDLFGGDGLDLERKGLLSQHGHGVIIPALAAGAVQNAHRQGDGPGVLARSGTIDLHPGGVGHVGGLDDVGIAAGDDNGGIFAVEAVVLAVLVQHIPVQVAGDGELNVAGDGVDPVCTGDSITSDILQAVIIEDSVQGVLILFAVVAGRNGHIEVFQNGDRFLAPGHVVRIPEGQFCGQCHIFGHAASAHHDFPGTEGVSRRRLFEGDCVVIAAPLDAGPGFVIHG